MNKRCSACGIPQHWSRFYMDKSKGRRRQDCKECVKRRSRAHYHQNEAYRQSVLARLRAAQQKEGA